MAISDLSGERFGRVTVMWPAGRHDGRIYWMASCDCGTYFPTRSDALKDGRTPSCGCQRRERAARGLPHMRHGLAGTPEHDAFNCAKQRCTNPNDKGYKNYGGRGIEFRFDSFEEFYACLGPKPTPLHSIDRINNDGHYEAGNVRWATRSEQNKNRRSLPRKPRRSIQ
jgi:hypothetical protein